MVCDAVASHLSVQHTNPRNRRSRATCCAIDIQSIRPVHSMTPCPGHKGEETLTLQPASRVRIKGCINGAIPRIVWAAVAHRALGRSTGRSTLGTDPKSDSLSTLGWFAATPSTGPPAVLCRAVTGELNLQ